MSSRGMSSGRETRRGGVRSGNGEFEFQETFGNSVWSKGDKFCLRLLLNCALELPVCNFLTVLHTVNI